MSANVTPKPALFFSHLCYSRPDATIYTEKILALYYYFFLTAFVVSYVRNPQLNGPSVVCEADKDAMWEDESTLMSISKQTCIFAVKCNVIFTCPQYLNERHYRKSETISGGHVKIIRRIRSAKREPGERQCERETPTDELIVVIFLRLFSRKRGRGNHVGPVTQ